VLLWLRLFFFFSFLFCLLYFELPFFFLLLLSSLVTYCIRWWDHDGDFVLSSPIDSSDEPEFYYLYGILGSLLLYSFWQLAYVLKTEHVDKQKLQGDDRLMTSSRWMTSKRPHPIYKYCVKRGYTGSAITLLALVQVVYTLLTLLPVPFMFSSFLFHTASLLFVFLVCLSNGSSFYFEIFSRKYVQRIQDAIAQQNSEEQKRQQSPARPPQPQQSPTTPQQSAKSTAASASASS
jgi:hypothetical protein